MSYSHYEVNETLKPARDLMDALRSLRAAWDAFRNVRGCLIQQQDAATGNATDFTSIAVNYGYAGLNTSGQQTDAKASFAEIDSAYNAGQSAITQMLDRHLTK
jgi:hypothetical protein